MKLRATQLCVLAIVGLTTASLASPAAAVFSREKVFYADYATVEFVRPGLVIKITSAQITADVPSRRRSRLWTRRPSARPHGVLTLRARS